MRADDRAGRQPSPVPESAAPDPSAASGADAAAARLRIAPAVLGLDRRSMVVIAIALVAVWLVLVFGRAVAQSNDVAARAAGLQAQQTALSQQLADKERERTVIQSNAFIALEARAYGYGTSKEHVFALRPGAPPPPTITPLGEEPAPPPAPTPLEAWLELLFGS